jgi:hypothetical protein
MKMKIKHGILLARFTAKFAPDVIEKWTRMVELWDEDHSQPNPYEEPENGMLLFVNGDLSLMLD